MVVITYNEALTQLCDWFDSLIAPRTIGRSNSNVIYLLFKAFAKGWEVINNTVVALSTKFDPATCSDDDLESVAFLVGTEKLGGSSSGLLVTVVNNASENVYLPGGTYSYTLDENTTFKKTFTADVLINAESSKQFAFISKEVGSFPVTAQTEISLTAVDAEGNDIEIPDTFSFANADNSALLGYPAETDLEFRKRIIEGTDRQDVITEIKDKIKSLPYIFDCNIVFNDTVDSITYDSYKVPPFYMLLLISGEMTSEVAKIVAEKGIYPTVMTDSQNYADYENNVFAGNSARGIPVGHYRVYATAFLNEEYSITVKYSADSNYISDEQAEEKMRTGLYSVMNGNRHKDSITENDIYNAIDGLNINGVKVLSVSFNDNADGYVKVPKTRIPYLAGISFSPVDSEVI